LGEFARIDQIFAPLSAGAPGAFGLTDDAALLPDAGPGQGWVVTNDAVVAGVHFVPDDPPDLVARKALRCNLSDLAAMGAAPYGYTVALAMPREVAGDGAAATDWVRAFARGLAEDQAAFGVHLLGGDSVSTPGPLWISITAFGRVDSAQALRRSGARPGDELWVTGTIGDGALGLLARNGRILRDDVTEPLVQRYLLPEPRTRLGPALVGIATAALDVSDGLVADAGHIAHRSSVRIEIDAPAMPLSAGAIACVDSAPDLLHHVLTGGDDYELLFTAPLDRRETIEALAAETATRISRIGRVTDGRSGVTVLDRHGEAIDSLGSGGWSHA
jgi:thiamine-monophosphate kinase